MINELRALLDHLLTEFEQCAGDTSDAYCDQPVFHAMAAGKYLSAQAEVVRAGLAKPEVVQRKVRSALHGLGTCVLAPPVGEGACWGLSFNRNDLPADEPYLITTAIVTRGLCDAATALPSDDECAALADRGLLALRFWCTQWQALDESSGTEMPAYSRGLKQAIYNAAAVAWAVLHRYDAASKEQAARKLTQIWACRIDGVGWRYDARSHVIDLIHQAYLRDAVSEALPFEDVEAHLLSTCAQFSAARGWVDVVHAVHGDAADAVGARWARRWADGWIALDSRHARLWSLGELLLVLAQAAAVSGSAAWFSRASAVAAEVLRRVEHADEEPELKFARHSMHLAHGLAAYICARRRHVRGAG